VLDPEQRIYDDRSIDGTFLIESGWRVDPHDAGARINWTTRYEPRGLMRLLAPALGTIIRRGPLNDLQRFAMLVASDSGDQWRRPVTGSIEREGAGRRNRSHGDSDQKGAA
jgi:hypothetical protein